MKKILAVTAALFLLGGCAEKVDMTKFNESAQDKAIAKNDLPDYVVHARKPRVAVLPAANATSFKKCSLQDNLTEQVTSVLAATGSYTVVERAQLGKVMNEVKFATGLGGGIDTSKLQKLAKQVDYAVIVSASGAEEKADFTEASSWTDKDGNNHYTPPSCMAKAKMTANIRIIAFPSGEIKDVIQQDGVDSNSYDVRYANQCRVQDVCGMLNSASGTAIDEIKEKLADSAPVYGYIYNIRSNGKDRVASISLGTNSGVKSGSELDVIQFEKETDPVKHTSREIENVLATCKVVDANLTATNAVCELDGDHVDLVKIKHAVRLRHEKSFFGKTKSFFRGLQDATF